MVFYIVYKTEDEEILIEIPDFQVLTQGKNIDEARILADNAISLDCHNRIKRAIPLCLAIETASTIHRIAINSFFIFIASYDVVSQTFKV